MVNLEFQELRRKHSVLVSQRAIIIEQMKKNLTNRNNGEDEYVFGYTDPNKKTFISECDFSGLCEIDGDMCPLGQ